MKQLATITTILALSFLAISVIACNNDKKVKEVTKNDTVAAKSNDTLIYNFVDATVPPQYHRSYSIRVTAGQVYYAVDSYGEIILQDSLVLTKPAYDSFVTAINDLHIKKGKEVINEDCNGGTTDQLNLYAGSSKEVKGYIYNCGGKKYGDLEGDVNAAAELFERLIPDLNTRIEATVKDK